MVSSPRQCPGVEGKVCGRFLPSKELDPHRLCVSCRGKSCHQDDRCDECHEWLEEHCRSVAVYAKKLSAQRKKKKERKAKSSSSSFSGFSAAMPVPLGQLSTALPGVVSTSASSVAVCAVTCAVAGPAVSAVRVTSSAVHVVEQTQKQKRVTDPKEHSFMMEIFVDWWASRRSTPLPGPSSAPQLPLITPPVDPVPGLSLALALLVATALSS